MRDADCVVEVIIQLVRRWSTFADREDIRLRHPADWDSLSVCQEKCERWACDLRRRQSSCTYWEQLATALRGAAKRKVDYTALPESVLRAVVAPAKGEFIPDEVHADAAAQLADAQRLVGCEGKFSDNRPSPMLGRPYGLRLERGSRGE